VTAQGGRDGTRFRLWLVVAGLVCFLLAWAIGAPSPSAGSDPTGASRGALVGAPGEASSLGTGTVGSGSGSGSEITANPQPASLTTVPSNQVAPVTQAAALQGPATTTTAPPVVVPVAADPAAQSSARDHWSPEAMEAAKPVDPAPAVTRPAAPDTVLSPPTNGGSPPVAGSTGAGTPSPPPTVPSTSAASVGTSSATPTTTTASPTPIEADTGTVWSRGGLAARTTGRVFFTLRGVDYTCSGSAVDSPDASTVLTAAHCIEDTDGTTVRWATRWAFVPGYDDGQAPYGVFVATGLAALGGFAAGDIGQDVALVNVGRNARGQRLVEAVGGQPMSFGGRVDGAVRSFGYPAAAPFDGTRLISCAGAVRPDPDSPDAGLDCTMTGGASGGPWLAGLDPVTGRGRLVSVTSFGYSDAAGTLYGPPLGGAAQQLYDLVASDPDR